MQCHECGAAISEKAADCPYCGTSVSAGEGESIDGDGDPLEDRTAAIDDETATSTGRSATGSTGGVVEGGGASGDTEYDEFGRSIDREDGDVSSDGRDGSDGDGNRDGRDGPEIGDDPGVDDGDEIGDDPDVDDDRSDADTHQAPASGHGPTTPGTPTDGPSSVGGETSQDTTEATGTAESVGNRDEAADVSTSAKSGSRDGESTDDGFDPVSFVTGIPWLPSAVAGVATALVVFILGVLVAVVIPSVDADTLEFGALVLFDLHFATPFHETPLVFENFAVARPPNAALGLLYLVPPLLVYTVSKAVVAFNVDDDRSLPVFALSGATLVVGYLPVVLVALFVAPPRTGGVVGVLGAVAIAGLFYPLLFGAIGGLFGGAYTGMERNVGALYGLVTVFLVMVATFALSFPAFGDVVDVDLLSRVLLSLFTIVGANAFSLGGSGTNAAILLVYPLVAGAVFAAGFVRAFRAPDVESPLRGFAKGVTPAGTYVVVLGVLAAVLPVFTDGYVQGELGMGTGASVVIDSLVFGQLVGIGQYATVLVVGTLVYPVLVGGGAGALAGGVRYAMDD